MYRFISIDTDIDNIDKVSTPEYFAKREACLAKVNVTSTGKLLIPVLPKP